MNDTQDEEDDEEMVDGDGESDDDDDEDTVQPTGEVVDDAHPPGPPLPGDVVSSSPDIHGDPGLTSIFDDDIPSSQPEIPEVNMTLGDEKMMTSDEGGGVIDKHAIVMISDDDTTPKKGVISESMNPDAATIASYQEKLKQLKAQLALTKKKNCAEKLTQ